MDRRKFLKAGTTLAVAASSSALAIDPVRSERIARARTIAGPG